MMATVVLTAVGSVLGGPIGAAIGAVIGGVIDSEVLFKPKGREGPRLSDLQVQTSTYGAQVPRLFGTMRVAGTVIWASDLKETRSRSGGGKGRPSVTSYSYSASFAVALSARAIGQVRRIWADGNLLRGAAGDFKTEISAFRVHGGGEEQPVDPLIASAQGISETPAHRGMAYVVFEDLALADYGNRIPSLTFEVAADVGAVPIEAIASDVSDGRLGGDGLGAVDGFAATGADVREAIAPLVDAYGLALDGLRLIAAGGEAVGEVGDRVARVNGRAVDPVERSSGAADMVPVALSLRHYDATRDYQAGVQKVMRPGAGRQERGIELPAVLDADAARRLAAARLGAAWTGRETMRLRCGWEALTIAPGRVVTVAGAAGLWRVEEREWEAMAVQLSLQRVPGAGGTLPAGASSGAIVRQPDAPHGVTHLMVADLPPLRDGVANAPLLAVAASGGPGWRSAALFVMREGGEAVPAGRSAGRAVMGTVEGVLPPGSWALEDRDHALTVTLLAEDMDLSSADEVALGQGANLCLVGRELVQFASAEPLGGAGWRLRGLRRGLRGTEWAMSIHADAEPFLLIEEERLAEPLAALGLAGEAGGALRVAALGLGDAEAVKATAPISGEALIPPAPVHLAVRGQDDGVTLRWVRRSRAGWRWSNGADVPLAEESERYVVRMLHGGTVLRSAETAAPEWTYTAAMIAADGASGLTLMAEVAQIGTLAQGRVARREIMA